MEGYHVKIEAVPWKRGLSYLEDGTGFALYPPYHRTKERPYIWPYSLPILDEKVIAICRESVFPKNSAIVWPESHYGLTIGINAGFSIGGDKFGHAVREGKIRLEEGRGNRINILKLGLGRIDCYVNDRLSILWKLRRMKEKGEYEEGKKHEKLLEGTVIEMEQGFVGFTARDKGKFSFRDDFVKKLDTIIYNMRKRGELQNIVDSFAK